MSSDTNGRRYVVCVNNEGYGAALIVRRIYTRMPDADGVAHGLVRVVDESGEDYLYPREMFAEIELPEDVEKRLGLGN